MDKQWSKYDNLGEGFIDVQRGAVFLRHAVGDTDASIGLQ